MLEYRSILSMEFIIVSFLFLIILIIIIILGICYYSHDEVQLPLQHTLYMYREKTSATLHPRYETFRNGVRGYD